MVRQRRGNPRNVTNVERHRERRLPLDSVARSGEILESDRLWAVDVEIDDDGDDDRSPGRK